MKAWAAGVFVLMTENNAIHQLCSLKQAHAGRQSKSKKQPASFVVYKQTHQQAKNIKRDK